MGYRTLLVLICLFQSGPLEAHFRHWRDMTVAVLAGPGLQEPGAAQPAGLPRFLPLRAHPAAAVEAAVAAGEEPLSSRRCPFDHLVSYPEVGPAVLVCFLNILPATMPASYRANRGRESRMVAVMSPAVSRKESTMMAE